MLELEISIFQHPRLPDVVWYRCIVYLNKRPFSAYGDVCGLMYRVLRPF